MDSKKTILIDLGTNTAIFSVVEVLDNRLIISYERSITTRIGQNIGKSGLITKEVLARNITMLQDELKKLRAMHHADNVCGMTTEAIRNARNGAECIEKINNELGIKLDVITGDEEALYTWFAVRHLIKDKSSSMAVCDIGGGSTEITFAQNNEISFIKSYPIGVVRLEEEFRLTASRKQLDGASKKITDTLNFNFAGPNIFFLSGGTATTVAAMMMGMKDYDPVPVEGTLITKQKIDELLERLFNLSIEEIKEHLRSDPGRYDVITAGVLMIKILLEKLHPSKTVVTTYGPRHGYLMNKLGIKDADDIIYRLK